MAKENPEDMVCTSCGCEIAVLKEPTVKYLTRNFTYCPVCKSFMIKRSERVRKVSVDALMNRFGYTTRNERRSITDRFLNGKKIFDHKKIKKLGFVGTTMVFEVGSEKSTDSYVVTKKNGFYTCNCKDHVFRHGPCKHIVATMLYLESNKIDPYI